MNRDMDEKRKFPRFPVTAPVICSRYGRRMTMRALDISQEGLKLEANFDLRVGESLDLAILLNGTEIRCRGEILAIEDLNHRVQARFRFTHASNSEYEKLSDYLFPVSRKPFEKRLIVGLYILTAASLTAIIGYTQYFHLGPKKMPFEKNRQFNDDISAWQASESKMEAETEPRKEDIQPKKETVAPVRSSQAGFSQKKDIQKIPEELATSQPSLEIKQSGAESQIIQGKSQPTQPSRLQEPESKEVSEKPAEVFRHHAEQQMWAGAPGQNAPATVNRAVIGRSAIALGVENREPVGVSRRISVREQRVYCWMHVLNGQGGKVSVRWIRSGQRIAEIHLPLGSNSWRTWSYLSLRPGMIGPAQVDILDENGKLLKSLFFQITE